MPNPLHTFLSLITIGDFHHSYGKSPKKQNFMKKPQKKANLFKKKRPHQKNYRKKQNHKKKSIAYEHCFLHDSFPRWTLSSLQIIHVMLDKARICPWIALRCLLMTASPDLQLVVFSLNRSD